MITALNFVPNVSNHGAIIQHKPTNQMMPNAVSNYAMGLLGGYNQHLWDTVGAVITPWQTISGIVQSAIDDPEGTAMAARRRNPANPMFLWHLGGDVVNAHRNAFNADGVFGVGQLHGGYAGQATVIAVSYGVGKAVAGTPAAPAAGGTAQKSAARPAGSLPAGRYRVVNQQPANAWGTSDDLLRVATTPGRGGVTPVGRAYQKHHSSNPNRAGSFEGPVSGNAAQNTQHGTRYLNEILGNQNATFTTRNTNSHGRVLDVRLPDGTGAQWSADGRQFIMFLEKYTLR